MAARLSDTLALRIGMAARCLPKVTVQQLMTVLVNELGMPLTDKKLQSLTVASLHRAFKCTLGYTPERNLAQCLAYLNGTETIEVIDTPVPKMESGYHRNSVHFLQVAVASDDGERLDGDFMTSKRFLIYQVSSLGLRLVALRENTDHGNRNNRKQTRLHQVQDCRLVYAKSINTPVSAALVAIGIHPVVISQAMPARLALTSLQQALENCPPPWLAKAAGLPLRVSPHQQTTASHSTC